MAEAELHVIRARLEGGIRNKAARENSGGTSRRLRVGDEDGEVLFHPDEAVTHAIRCVFEKFAELGSARQCGSGSTPKACPFPLSVHLSNGHPTYTAIHEFSPVRSMQAPTLMVKHIRSAMSMRRPCEKARPPCAPVAMGGPHP